MQLIHFVFVSLCFSSLENIAVFIWQGMKEKVGELLYEIKVHETEKNVGWYRGENE